MRDINAYLMYDGNCSEAMKFYQQCFGGDLQMMPFSEIPGGKVPLGCQNRIMHARLTVGDVVLMGSDVRPGGGEYKVGNQFSVSVNCESKQQVDDLTRLMQAGGKVTLPAQQMFWGAYFGMLTDQFGIDWMFNYDPPTK